MRSLSEALTACFAARGVARLFGVPGGGSSLDLVRAAADHGIDFVLTAGETSAAIMAAVTGELSGAPGVALTTLGPGAASVVNGTGYAYLDRAPLMVVSDTLAPGSTVSHQALDQVALFAPITKARARLGADTDGAELAALLDLTLRHPQGPVHLELAAAEAGLPAAAGTVETTPGQRPAEAALDAANDRLAAARRPVLIVGLQARGLDAPVTALADGLSCPVLTTYKAKGTVADDHPGYIGLFTGAAAEADCVSRADLIVFCGLDPVELIPAPWRYDAPIVELGEVAGLPHYAAPEVSVIGPLAETLARLGVDKSDWPASEVADLREAMRARLTMTPSTGIGPRELVEAVRAAAPAEARLVIDAGAHMIPAMAGWPARASGDVLISNGLSTMGFALPAGIAAALHAPGRPVVAFTGDGGLMMCLGELATAARRDLDLTVVVFNDAALSLIEVKRQARQMPIEALEYSAVDFAEVARGLGLRGYRVAGRQALAPALAEAFAGSGPALVDVAIDPSGYGALLEALRG
jgi:acetolactate synthase-1/2/3 large subunit